MVTSDHVCMVIDDHWNTGPLDFCKNPFFCPFFNFPVILSIKPFGNSPFGAWYPLIFVNITGSSSKSLIRNRTSQSHHPANQSTLSAWRIEKQWTDDVGPLMTINIWNCKMIQHHLMHIIHSWSKLPTLCEESQRLQDGPWPFDFQHKIWQLLNVVNGPLPCNNPIKMQERGVRNEMQSWH